MRCHCLENNNVHVLTILIAYGVNSYSTYSSLHQFPRYIQIWCLGLFKQQHQHWNKATIKYVLA